MISCKAAVYQTLILIATLTLAACGGSSSNDTTVNTSTNNPTADTPTDRPIFNRALASRAPNFLPSGNITDSNPTFTWTAINNASEYILGHEDTDTETNWVQYTIDSTTASCGESCSFTPTDSNFSIGDEKVWWVRAIVAGELQDWSTAHIFEIIRSTNTNTVPVAIFPIGENSSLNPEFSWTAVTQATQYQFGFEDPKTESGWKSYTLTPSESSCSSTEASCSFNTSDSGLVPGDTRRWWVRAEIDGIWGEWSDGVDFSITNIIATERPFMFVVKGFTTSGGQFAPRNINDFVINTDPRYTYNYNVDCDSDGILEASNLSNSYTCIYDNQAPVFNKHTVSITGKFPAFYQTGGFNSRMIIDVRQWGSQVWKSMEKALLDSRLETLSATDIPNLSQVTSMKAMFSRSSYPITNDNGANAIASWDVSNITDMSEMFYLSRTANPNISGWDVSNVKNMSLMFGSNIFNQDISNWDVSSVTDLRVMFSSNKLFNQDISNWDVSNVTNMSGIFGGAKAFNQDISNWDVSNVTNMRGMFSASNFDQDISNWDIRNVTDISRMFSFSRFNQDINNWNVSKVTNMSGMFQKTEAFNQNISNWDVSNVTDMSSMFEGTVAFNQDISNWDVSKVENMLGMFADSTMFNQDISSWDTSNVSNMTGTFNGAKAFNQDIGNWNVANVTTMRRMFSNTSIFNQNIDNWDVGNVTSMISMFDGAKKFNKPLNNWDVSKVETMDSMFKSAPVFNQEIGNWDTSSLNWTGSMFAGASEFNQDISAWDTSKVDWMQNMFLNASKFNQNIGTWDMSKVITLPNLSNTSLSSENYDQILIGWSNQTLQRDERFTVGSTKYSSNAMDARNKIINQFGWTISDGGLL